MRYLLIAISLVLLCSPAYAGDDWYASALAGGGGDGSVGSPWTLAEVVTNINNTTVDDGDVVNFKADGTYTIATVAFTNNGAANSYITLRGYTTAIGDGGRATIQKTAASGDDLFQSTSQCYRFEDLILDGNSTGSYVLDGNRWLIKNCEIKNAGTIGIEGNTTFVAHCYIHNCGTVGVYNSFVVCSDSVSNSTDGFGVLYGGAHVVARLNTDDGFENCMLLSDFVAYDNGDDGVVADYECLVINGDVTEQDGAGDYGLYENYPSPGGYYIGGINLSDNDTDCNDFTRIEGGYTQLAPEYNNAAGGDFTRTGTNLDATGVDKVGLETSTPSYHTSSGPDQAQAGGGGGTGIGVIGG